jgi:glycolate oxidase FAD binding subunit
VECIVPETPEQLAEALAKANRDCRRLGVDFRLSLERLNRVLQYTPDDLTVSVEAGVTLGELNRRLAEHRQWLPLGAPRAAQVTAGQALAEYPSGPFRLFYGTLRDMVLGVRFATVEGKLVKSGGQVVKNVAGYDLSKLLIGSRDTLAIPVQVNFRVHARPEVSETSAFAFPSLAAALDARTAIQQSPLTPLALDLLDAAAAHIVSPQELPPGEWLLLVAYGGVERVIERYRRDLQEMARRYGVTASATLTLLDEQRLWDAVSDLPAHMEEHAPPHGTVVVRLRAASTIAGIRACIEALPADAVVSRAGTGVTYFYKETSDASAFVAEARRALAGKAESVVVETPSITPMPPITPITPMSAEARWGPTGSNFALMTRIKQSFDPNGILNPGVFVGGL